VAEGELLRDDAAAREACDVGGTHVEGAQHPRGVVGHCLYRGWPLGHHCAARSAVVEGGQAVAVGESVELELPRLDGVSKPADQEHFRSLADLLGPDLELAGQHVFPHL
jgi:hypothetical protein